MSATSAYKYKMGCGWFTVFEAESDSAAAEHAAKVLRDPADPDFDGDSANLWRVETDEDGGEYGDLVESWDGEDMVPDPDGERGENTFEGGWN